MKFSCAFSAYEWAQGVLSPWRNGRAFDPDPEQFRGGTGAMGAIIAAIAIDQCAERACHAAGKCPQFNRECFVDWWLPDPTIAHPERSSAQIRRIEDCAARFDEMLRDKGIVE